MPDRGHEAGRNWVALKKLIAIGSRLISAQANELGAVAQGPVTAKSDLQQRVQLLDDFESSGLGWFWATDSQGRLTYISDKAAQQLGSVPAELIGKSLLTLFETDRSDNDEEAARPLAFIFGARNALADLTVRLTERHGWWSISGRPQQDERGNFLGYRGSARDITAVYQRQCDASRLSQYDSLTGLANRHRMNQRLDATLTAFRVTKRSCALIMLDLDRFKAVNDTLGHPAGDDLLKQVAQRLERLIGKQGEIGRLGGDEFQILLPDMDDRARLAELADRIIQMVSQPYSVAGSRVIIGTSVGIAVAPYDGLESKELVKAADLALYAGKAGGRGQYRFYSTDLKDSAQERRSVEEDLRDALAKGELKLVYQPVVRASDNVVSGFEALMRWEHAERGTVSPALFIPIAEDSGLINQLGEWALRQACADAANWPGKLRVAVNVSANQFSADGLPSIIVSALAASGLDPAQLELEITESVFVGESTLVDEKFKALKSLGVRLALDDFGTGYSSLSYLRAAPFDKIKIDQSFVRGCTETEKSNSAIIQAIISLANALDMETTAEGVEAVDQLDQIMKQGATYIQGFIFSKPVPNETVVEKLAAGDFVYSPVGPAKYRPDRRTMYRRVGIIHEDQHYEAVMRNLSKTGAMIEGLLHVPLDTQLVIDLGNGQLALATVRRSDDAVQGIEFETPLICDGADGWVTRHRVSPYALAAAGMPLAALPPGNYPLGPKHTHGGTTPRFMQVTVSTPASRAA
jgi:diguanylate cyclase (GGDEF)-like protein/PAS domain S-box-containing protein